MTSPGPYEVPLGGPKAAGRVALIDAADAGLVMSMPWRVQEMERANGRNSGPYAIYPSSAGTIYMHKLITGYALADHVNHNGLDNQRHNLRPATHAQNGYNRQPNRGGASPYKGVGRSRSKWRACIRAEGTSHWLGTFADEVAAARAYDDAARILHGEFAYLNFPGPGDYQFANGSAA